MNKHDYLQAFLIALMMISYLFIPILGALLLFVISLLNFKTLIVIAKMPCPRCNEKFGKVGLFSNLANLNKCQNCHLELEDNDNSPAFSRPLIMTLAIITGFMGGALLYLSFFVKTNNYGLFLGGVFIVGAFALFFLSQKRKKH